jgi:hypothetical protein
VYTSASLSLFGLVNIFAVYFTFKQKQHFTMKLLIYNSVFLFGGSVSWFLNTPDPPSKLCYSGAIFSTFFYVSVFLWSCCVAFNYYHVMREGEEYAHRFEKFYLVVCLSIPACCVIVPLSLGLYTRERMPNEVGCWFSDDAPWARIAFFDGWIFFSWIYITVVLILAQKEARKMRAYAQLTPSFEETTNDQATIVKWILLSCVLCWTWSVILAIFAVIRDYTDREITPEQTFVPLLLFSIFCPFQGFLNFLVLLLFSREFKHQWKMLILTYCCPCCYDRKRVALIDHQHYYPYYHDDDNRSEINAPLRSPIYDSPPNSKYDIPNGHNRKGNFIGTPSPNMPPIHEKFRSKNKVNSDDSD